MAMMATSEVRPFREVIGNQLVLNMHPGQKRVFDSKARFVFLLGGTQVGKTCLGPHWLHREIQRKGVGDYLIVTATYPLLEMKLLPEFKLVFQDMFKLGELKLSPLPLFQFNDGITRVIFCSATHPESMESATAKAAWLDECGQEQFRRESWEAVQRRLSLSQGNVLGTTTLYNWGWLKLEIYDKWRQGQPDIEVIQVDSLTNPAFPAEEYYRMEKTLPAWKFNMFYRGQYDRPAGMVYDSFDQRVCKIARFPIPENWLIYAGHDFGGVHPAALFYAQDPATGLFYLWNEYKPHITPTVAEMVEHFKEITRGRTVIRRVGGSHQEQGWREDFSAHGWVIEEPTVLAVDRGIEKVYALHKQNKLFIFDDLYAYLDEKLSYSWKLNDRYEVMNELQDKASYHLMDCERYIMSSLTPELAIRAEMPVWRW